MAGSLNDVDRTHGGGWDHMEILNCGINNQFLRKRREIARDCTQLEIYMGDWM